MYIFAHLRQVHLKVRAALIDFAIARGLLKTRYFKAEHLPIMVKRIIESLVDLESALPCWT